MLNLTKSAIAGVAVATMIAASSLASVPAANAEPGFYGAEVIKVGSRGWKGGKNWNRNWNGGGHYNYRNYNYGHYNYGWNNNWWVGPAIGFGTGILLGSVLAQPRYYYAPRARYYAPAGNRDAYCHSKYRSYNSYTGTYTGYDGRQHYCR